jgi:hypothetical protein
MYIPRVAFQSELLDTGLWNIYITGHLLDPYFKIKFVQFFTLSTINSNYNTVTITFTFKLPFSKKEIIHSNTVIVYTKYALCAC